VRVNDPPAPGHRQSDETRHRGDGIEISDRIVQGRALEQRFVDMRKRSAKQQHVAVGLGSRNGGRADGAASTAHVLDDHDA